MSEILMPRLSDSMEEGTIVKWLKAEGDEVAEGEELVEIETDKANMVYEADEGGTLTEIVAQEGDTVALGEPIAKLGEGGGGSSGDAAEASGDEDAGDEDAEAEEADDDAADEDAAADGEADEDDAASDDEADRDEGDDAADEAPSADAGEEGEGDEPSRTSADATPDSGPSAESSGDDAPRVKASPLARRIASESGVDLSSVTGSGPGGRILRADVEAAASGGAEAKPAEQPQKSEKPEKADKPKKDKPEKAEKPDKPAADKPAAKSQETAKGTTETVELTRLQQTVSRRMSESKATAPHFYLQTEIDMTRCFDARAAIKAAAAEGDVVPSFNDMVVKACAVALREYPRANGAYKDGRFELYSRINVGIAVAGRDALVVPTIFDADEKGLRRIAADARELAGKVREQKITPPELSGATFTVSNLGMYGVTNFHAVINSPQAAILAVGAINEQPVVRDGEITTARMMGVTLACDHRILYGADGAQFLARVRALLEEPLGLAL